jgi:ubiquinone/menaquinone biosynthesis C-methylase UbiE
MSTGSREQFDRTAAIYAVSRAHSKGESLKLLKKFAGDRRFRVGIDVATGPGFTAFAVADQCERVIATDISEGMLQQVERLAIERGIENVERALADAQDLPFEDGSVDLVTCRTAPHHFASIPEFLKESRRVLAAEGLMLLADTTTSENERARTWHQDMERRRDPSHVHAPTPSGWCSAVEAAGFSITDQAATTVDMTFNDWVHRSKTPASEVEAMRQEWSVLDDRIATEYSIRSLGAGDFSFSWPVIVLQAAPA